LVFTIFIGRGFGATLQLPCGDASRRQRGMGRRFSVQKPAIIA